MVNGQWLAQVLSISAVTVAACVPAGGQEQASATESSSSSGDGATSPDPTASGGAPSTSTSSPMTSSASMTAPSASESTQPDDADTDDSSGTVTTTNTTTTTGAGGSICGDGMIDDDEECDDGDDNSDNAACKADCTLAYCGDKKTQLGKESCDNGDKNGDGSYGGCTDLCQLGPHCGDKIHQPDEEECDAMDSELEDGAKCVGCKWDANLIFVSSTGFSGELGGLAGADQACQELADAAILPNPAMFRAWLSVGQESPQSRFEPPAMGSYILPNGSEVAASWDELVNDVDLQTTVNIDENKTAVAKPLRAWSNTSSTGLGLDGPDCNGWTSKDLGVFGSFGSVGEVNSLWSNAGTELCSKKYRLYCVATVG